MKCMLKIIKKRLILSALTLSTALFASSSYAQDDVVIDDSRNRSIPVNITLPNNHLKCSVQVKCQVVFVNAGYGISHNEYTFVSKLFKHCGST